jgi:hypothetical protein
VSQFGDAPETFGLKWSGDEGELPILLERFTGGGCRKSLGHCQSCWRRFPRRGKFGEQLTIQNYRFLALPLTAHEVGSGEQFWCRLGR